MPTIVERFQRGWNAFVNNKDPTMNVSETVYYGGYSYRPDRVRLTRGHERSIINAIYNRIAEDVAAVEIQHVSTDENGLYVESIDSGLNNVLTLEANIDQTSRAFLRDIVMSMFDEGVVAVVPVDARVRDDSSVLDVYTARTGRITAWYPNAVRVEVYNEKTGRKQEITLPKRMVAILENPFYSIMNEPNSTLQRLIRKLNLLDAIDEQSGAGKLDLIIQLPYTIRSEARRQQAENRRRDIESQLTGSKYGIAYTDGTEKIVQLNRPVDNNLMKQIEYLTETLMGQLGITNEILNGTANESTMMNYYTRLIEPILTAIVGEWKRKFLTPEARKDGQSIMFFREPFKLVPASNLADIADKFTRNEILSPNELRRIIGYKPSEDPKSDELRNRNINQSGQELTEEPMSIPEEIQNEREV